jgi:monoterpene epsilon-lactone hydrolase
MSSPEADVLKEMFALYRPPVQAPGRSVAELREMTAQAMATQPAVDDADIDDLVVNGVAVERTRARGVDADRLVVYVHGGGYLCGSAGGQRVFLAALARAAGAEVLAVDYRLAPEHPHPAALDDVVAAYEGALNLADGRPVVVGGDSAGGGLAVGAMLVARDRGIAMPSRLFALSPWADMTLTSSALETHAEKDLMVRANDLRTMRDCYIGSKDPTIASVSPATADLSGLPPLLVQVGGDEVLVGDARLLVDRAVTSGVEATLDVADGMFHTYQVLAPHLPESQAAIQSLGNFVAV